MHLDMKVKHLCSFSPYKNLKENTEHNVNVKCPKQVVSFSEIVQIDSYFICTCINQ